MEKKIGGEDGGWWWARGIGGIGSSGAALAVVIRISMEIDDRFRPVGHGARDKRYAEIWVSCRGSGALKNQASVLSVNGVAKFMVESRNESGPIHLVFRLLDSFLRPMI